MEMFGIDASPCSSTMILITAVFAAIVLLKWWTAGRKCYSLARLDGKTVIITGANTGIGKETAFDLARRGARIILACRDEEKGEAAAKDIRIITGNSQIIFAKLNLSSFQSIRDFSEKILASESEIHILINNAGIAATPCQETEDGYEMQFGVNHLGHFLLTLLLLERITQSAPARIVNLSSLAYKRGRIHFDDLNLKKKYSPYVAYCQSKLANILFTRELAKYLQGTGVSTYSVHPGVVRTELGRYLSDSTNIFIYWMFQVFTLLFKTSKQGAQTTVHCAVAEELCKESGHHYSECRQTELSANATDDAVTKKLWEISERIAGIKITDLNLRRI